MAISIDGTGTITGISVGGLNDSIITSSELANAAVTAAKLGTNTFVSYAVIADQKTNGTGGGTFTSGAWRTRDLNTELFDPDGIVTISSNQFTLQAGSYLIRWGAPVFEVEGHRSGLYDITGTTFIEYSMSMFADAAFDVANVSSGSARVTITAANTYEIQHRCTATKADTGFGGGQSSLGDAETYTMVEIYKEA